MAYCRARGVVREVWFGDTVYLIHSPAFYVTATELEQWYRGQGFNTVRLNVGAEEDAELAERLLELCTE
jgi:hypothetical protein